MIQRIIACLALAVLTGQTERDSAKKPDFVVTAEVLFTLEDGPLVVRTSLQYQGTKPIEIASGFGASISLPSDWAQYQCSPVFRLRSEVMSGIFSPTTSVRPGQTWTTVKYLHHRYERIPSGKINLQIENHIHKPGKEPADPRKWPGLGDLLAKPSTTLTVDIPEATPERVREIAVNLEREARKADLADEERFYLTDTILHTRHPEFIPTGIALLKKGHQPYSRELIRWMYDTSRTRDAASSLLVGALLKEDSKAALDVFDYWTHLRWRASSQYLSFAFRKPTRHELMSFFFHYLHRPHEFGLDSPYVYFSLQSRQKTLTEHLEAKAFHLPDSTFKILSEAKNIWIKTLTHVTFPECCNRAWMDSFHEDVKRLVSPPNREETESLLGDLEKREFAVRKRAADKLLRYGDKVQPFLREALNRSLSLEVKRQVELILADLDKAEIDPGVIRVLDYIARRDTPQARAILQTLAQGADTSRLGKHAKELLNKSRP